LFTSEVELTSKKLMGLNNIFKKLKGTDIKSEKVSEYFAAYTFGMISPNSSNKNVTITIVNKNGTHAGVSLKLIIESVKKLERTIIPTFTKLLVINMVANRCSGFFNRFNTSLPFFVFFVFRLSRLAGDKEKKATSEPETNAELINNITITVSPIKFDSSSVLNTMLFKMLLFSSKGSVSKVYLIYSTKYIRYFSPNYS